MVASYIFDGNLASFVVVHFCRSAFPSRYDKGMPLPRARQIARYGQSDFCRLEYRNRLLTRKEDVVGGRKRSDLCGRFVVFLHRSDVDEVELTPIDRATCFVLGLSNACDARLWQWFALCKIVSQLRSACEVPSIIEHGHAIGIFDECIVDRIGGRIFERIAVLSQILRNRVVGDDEIGIDDRLNIMRCQSLFNG